MKFEAATIKDIAKALGLSTSTVSRALRDSYEISEATKKKIKDYAAQINYRPNPVALSLKEKRTLSIGVLVSEIANTFFSQVINGIESIAYKNGYNVIITQSKESVEREEMILDYLTSRSIDGLIISVSAETNDFTNLKQLHEKGLPIVFFDRVVEEINTHKVVTDNLDGVYRATQHLLQNQCKRISVIANNANLSITKERLAGYKKALNEYKMNIDESLIKYCDHGGLIVEEVEKVVDELLTLKKKPDAMVLLADKITTETFSILKKKNINMPQDIAVIGFNNSKYTSLFSPALSVISQPAFEMGEQAAQLLLNLIESKRAVTDFKLEALAPEIIIRESSQISSR
ncbi:LacI family DNA-binding transcriptional regulator [Niabella ginsengisoli]|uniref:LacI family transcriptional regulator n=1 Tax=Niabella ginsengisoli TaxID=522298 RepID=A0ABS9SPE4_9BACT|nr:LacI family DNA-binding transcriptional regulator [Niabella ginsengisoli]MCH5600215.1 LacI family transcriptional regulator [Niabella ginsengisoli]